MISIGQLAHSSGLTPKALRFYDQKGLLVPHHVEGGNGYRRYAAGQVRDAVMIKVLRRMGMPLSGVREALDAPDRCADLLQRFSEEVAAQHAAQAEAITQGCAVLASYEHRLAAHERDMPAQHWVGAVEHLDFDAEEAAKEVEASNHIFALLHRALSEAAQPPVGMYWSETRPNADGRGGQLLRCWPVAGPVGEDFTVTGLRLEQGLLPQRREAFVSVLFDDLELDETPVDVKVPHVGEIALMEYLDEVAPDLTLGELGSIRQIGLFDEGEAPIGFELAVIISPHRPLLGLGVRAARAIAL